VGKDFKPLTVEDFGLSPNDMKILVLGSRLFAGPPQTEPEETSPAKPEEESTNADKP